MSGPRRLVGWALALAVAGCGGDGGSTAPEEAEEQSAYKTGVWEGRITSGWPGTLSFRVSGSSFGELTLRVPVFGAEQSGCETSWTQSIPIAADGSYTVQLTDNATSTSMSIEGSFTTQTQMAGSVVGTCKNRLVLLGMQYSASWVRD